VREIYLSDSRPWVVGYSGGKDSTTALQIIWTALQALPPKKRSKHIYVISSDTLVETPVVSRYIDVSLERIAKAAVEQSMPIVTHKVVPEVGRSFWVNLIGRGYPAPSRRFRWCTERLKIEPANDFIRSRVAEFGEVVMVLGVRSQESATRAQVMSLHKIEGSRLSKHSSLLNAFVYAPISDFSTDEVWTYLLQNPSPWGNDNRDLVAMYRNAASGECPLVVDTTTPSCGNSRFGCWVCTVVERDKAMEAMIDSGVADATARISRYALRNADPRAQARISRFPSADWPSLLHRQDRSGDAWPLYDGFLPQTARQAAAYSE
jgi:DNA sulfur modification protein DndC